jgi:hypothetical protein
VQVSEPEEPEKIADLEKLKVSEPEEPGKIADL